jgi:hypothetical protein
MFPALDQFDRPVFDQHGHPTFEVPQLDQAGKAMVDQQGQPLMLEVILNMNGDPALD